MARNLASLFGALAMAVLVGCGGGETAAGEVTPVGNPPVTSPAVTTPAVTSPVVTTPTVTSPPVTSPTVTTPTVPTPTTTPTVTTPTVTTPTGTPARANIGINIGAAVDWDRNRLFADAMKSSRTWQDQNNGMANLTTSSGLDAAGWPTRDASIVVWHGIPSMNGTYALSFTGKATVAAQWANTRVVNQTYDATTNKTSAKVEYLTTDGSGLMLRFDQTQRTATSNLNTGVTNVALMRPKAVGGTEAYTSEVFTAPFLATLAPYSVLRTMDFVGTNQAQSARWVDRTRPAHASQHRGNPTRPVGNYQGRGAAWEFAVLLANQTGKDLWISVPAEADNDYITKLAQLIRYGSDGTNPYTSAQASPVWPGLASGRKLYVEYSNELWNTIFAQTDANHAAAKAEVAAGSSPLNFDGETNEWNWGWRRVAARTVDISKAFRSVWGDAAMMTQVRPVLMSQLGYTDGPLYQAMHMMVDYYANPNRVGTAARLPNHYVYGVGGSAYYSPSDKSSVSGIFATLGNGFASQLQKDADWALAFGLKRIAYEGGPGMDRTSNTAQDANQSAAWADARMTQAVITQHTTWDRNAGDLLVYFSLTGDFQWGFMEDVLTPVSPKTQAIAAIAAATPAVSTYGTAMPGSIAASSAAIPPVWTRSGTSLGANGWLGYPVKVTTAGRFRIALTASAATSAQAEILVDGVSLGSVAVPASGVSAVLVTPTLAAGSHGIVVRNTAGSFTLSQIQVTAN